jgi:hypothetical protein
MPSLIKDLAGFFLGSAPESAKARVPPPTTPTQRDDKAQRDEKKDTWWWETREADRDAFASSRHRAHLPRCKRTGRPLKILALHGRGSNNDITAIQLSSLEIPTRCVADLLSAPHSSSPQSDVFHMLSNREFHEWGHDEKALKGVLAYIERYGPYDGLYGFSQGAAVVTALSKPGVAEGFGSKRTWRFVICACGVPPPGDGTVDLPSLQISGAMDPFRAASKALADVYEAPVLLQHAGGHELPLKLRHDARFKDALDAFFDRALEL